MAFLEPLSFNMVRGQRDEDNASSDLVTPLGQCGYALASWSWKITVNLLGQEVQTWRSMLKNFKVAF